MQTEEQKQKWKEYMREYRSRPINKGKHAKYMSEWYKKPENRKKKNAENRKYRARNWDRVRDWERGSAERNNAILRGRIRSLKKRYSITIEDYDRMFEEQRGVCKICGSVNLDGRRLAVDHCHVKNVVRGLLCGPCNRKLGWYEILKDNIHKYLEQG